MEWVEGMCKKEEKVRRGLRSIQSATVTFGSEVGGVNVCVRWCVGVLVCSQSIHQSTQLQSKVKSRSQGMARWWLMGMKKDLMCQCACEVLPTGTYLLSNLYWLGKRMDDEWMHRVHDWAAGAKGNKVVNLGAAHPGSRLFRSLRNKS